MSDLISRRDAVNTIKLYECDDYKINMGLIIAMNLLENVPSAQQERKTGKWTPEYHCSECGFEVDDKLVKYCPWCGARMVGEP